MNFLDTYNEINNLNESFEPMLSDKEVENIFNTCIDKLNSCSQKSLHIDKDRVIFGGIASVDTAYGEAGTCNVERINGKICQKITIGDRTCYKSAMKYLLTTIYHELLHAIDLQNALTKRLNIYLSDGKTAADKYFNDYAEESNSTQGHTKSWYELVDLFNKVFKLEVPVTRYGSSEEEKFINSINSNTDTKYDNLDDVSCPGIIIQCGECDMREYNYNTVDELKTNPKLAKLVKQLLNKPGSVNCPRCGEPLWFDFANDVWENGCEPTEARLQAWKDELNKD